MFGKPDVKFVCCYRGETTYSVDGRRLTHAKDGAFYVCRDHEGERMLASDVEQIEAFRRAKHADAVAWLAKRGLACEPFAEPPLRRVDGPAWDARVQG